MPTRKLYKTNACVRCKGKCSYNALRCNACARIARRKVNGVRPSDPSWWESHLAALSERAGMGMELFRPADRLPVGNGRRIDPLKPMRYTGPPVQ